MGPGRRAGLGGVREPVAGWVGSWTGSDGCNGLGGRWSVGAGGELLATAGPETTIGCENVAIAQWLTTAVTAALDGGTLVLLDAAGTAIGRLQPV